MKKYTQLLIFGILLLVLSVGLIECLHVFAQWSRSLHGFLLLPLIYLVWVLQGTKEHRTLLRALNYRFRNHSKELVWKELYEKLYGEEVDVLYQWANESWQPIWNESTHSALIDRRACTNVACVDMVKQYLRTKSDGFGRKLFKRWVERPVAGKKSDMYAAEDIYVVAALAKLDL